MKVKKYSAEFVHKEDGTIVVDERTLIVIIKNIYKSSYNFTLYIFTYERKDKDRERNNTM